MVHGYGNLGGGIHVILVNFHSLIPFTYQDHLDCYNIMQCILHFCMQEEYIKLVSQFKLETAVEQELEAFLSGFWEVSKTSSLPCSC